MFSKSIRGAITEAFEAFGAGNEALATSFLSDRAVDGCDMESDLLNAAGSMAGIVVDRGTPPKRAGSDRGARRYIDDDSSQL